MGIFTTALVLAQAPVCLPGTTVCAISDGQGGVRGWTRAVTPKPHPKAQAQAGKPTVRLPIGTGLVF